MSNNYLSGNSINIIHDQVNLVNLISLVKTSLRFHILVWHSWSMPYNNPIYDPKKNIV